MAMKKGLGKGLDALLGEFSENAASGIQEVDIYLIDTNAEQPRKSFDEDKLRELAASIERHGILQPIVVRQNGERYTIVMGERRYRAARLNGMTTVPVIVRTLEDAQAMEAALVENLQREDLNPVEEAAGIRYLMDQQDLTQEEAAARLGKSRPAIANSLRLLTLSEPVLSLLREGKLQAGHARALITVRDEAVQCAMAEKIVRNGLTVRDAEVMTKEKEKEKPAKKPKSEPMRDSDLTAAEAAMRDSLGTKVLIQGDAERGRIMIEYYSKRELQNLYDAIVGLRTEQD
ncbi:MAG: ParB/RepB/Spo0J family partition protein [Eubacteriales bacterium]|nr:ParB/RepB/Spo0J family partition protein [Eubacteriales bacterium]